MLDKVILEVVSPVYLKMIFFHVELHLWGTFQKLMKMQIPRPVQGRGS